MRKNILRQRRGITLVELTVVMAITAIITLMIVSLSTLISAQVKQNDARADFLANVTSFRTSLQQQFAEKDTSATEFDVSKLDLTENFEYIDSVTYEINDGAGESKKLLKITVKSTTLNQEQSFVLVSRLGATFTRGAGA